MGGGEEKEVMTVHEVRQLATNCLLRIWDHGKNYHYVTKNGLIL